jgi:nucleotide-binding universal stress UspA family protein
VEAADANKSRPILVVVDPEQSSLLVHHAAAHARRTGARVILAHVLAPDPAEKKTPPGIVRFATPARCRAVLDKMEFAALQLLWQGILCDPVVLSGDPAEQIVAIARARGADRLLLSAHESSLMTDPPEASIARCLIGELDIPLFVFGPQAITLPETNVSGGRILLALSLRHHRSEYIKFASRLATQTCSRLALLHVVSTSGTTEQQRQQTLIRARRELAAIAASEPDSLFPIEIIVREGDALQAILEEAVYPHRDCIVMGKGGTRNESGFRNGIVHHVIENARCPVVALTPFHNAQTEAKDLPAAVAGAAD